MKILDTATTEIVKGNSARYYSKYIVDKKEHTDTLNNFKFQNMINPNNEITIGNTCSSGVTFSIYMPTVSLENKEITIFEGVKVGTEIKYIKLGIFTVTKQTSDGEYTNYEAYDRMYKADMPYFSDMAFPSTDKAILNEICGKLGISLATNIVTAHTISDKPQGYTYREIIGYMAMLQGGNAVINSDGNLELRWYKDSGYVLDGHKYYQQSVTFTTSKDFIIQKLTCNNTKSGSTEQSQITSGDGATGLSFANPFMTQAILDEVYKKIGGFTFRPLTVKFVGDYRLEVGDIITVNKGGVDYKVPIMQITHECDGGLMDTVTSIGQSDTENTSVASGPITKQMERYYADLILVNKALINKLSVDEADIRYASIETLKAVNADIDNLKTNKLDATYADIINANVESLKAVNADIANLKVDYEKVGILDASVADIKTLIFGSATGTTITTDFSNSVIAVLGEAQIKSAMIDSLDASKITALDINTTNVLVHSEDGKSQWKDNTIQISDSNRVRVQIGKDANSDYNMYIWDKSGNLMFDAIGLTDKGIQRQVIRDDMVKDNADIAASKLNIESLFNVINNDGSHTLNSTKIYVDSEQQTLDSVFKSIQTTVGGNSTLWGSAIKQSKDFIDQKLWWTDIRNGESIESKFNTVTSTLDSFGVQIGDVYKQLNDDFKVYQVTYEPTKDNYPANEWSVPIYPSDDRYPSDSTWEYTEAEYDNYVGIIAYWEAQNRAWRWIKKIDGTHGWKEISSTEIAYLLNQNAALKVNLNTISSELNKTQIDIRDNYSTTVQVNNAITQAISAESNSIKSEISTTYVTKNALTGYSTTEAMNNAITQAITKESNSIKLEVSGTYATKNDINNLQIGGVNRFIKSTVTPNKYITATGIITDGGNYWDLTDYIDVSKWKNYVASGWTNLGNAPATCFYDSNKKFISGVADKSTGVRGSLPVPSNAAYMRFSFAHVDTNKLKIEKGTKATDYSPAPEDIDVKFNNYATTASLEAYIKKDPTTGELKSAIEAIADDITLNASGTINISGNKSVNINGNLFTLTSTNTTISADGSIDCKKLKAVNADLEGTFKNVNVTDGGITMTTTIIGGEYLIKSSTGAFLQIQGHYIEMSNDDGSGTNWILSRSECVFNDYLNVKLYHPSLKNYMRPALSMSNPVTFDWSGSVLTIYVDDVAVATWDWAQKNWY
jgi:hypothetical protein